MMNNSELENIEKLFSLSRTLKDNPNENTLSEVFNTLDQLVQVENATERYLNFSLKSHAIRRPNSEQEIIISDTPISITVNDTNENKVIIVLEVDITNDGPTVLGVLHADIGSPWSEFTVLISQQNIIEDYVETHRDMDFKLDILGTKEVSLKFISSVNDFILLENILIDLR